MALIENNYTFPFQPIEHQLFQVLDELIVKSYGEKLTGNTVWTKNVKQVISDLAYSNECIASSNNDGREWLYDLIWFKIDKEEYFSELVLCMESEWDKNWNQIKYDFDKLLISNATHKLMICQAYEEKTNEILNNFQKSINRYQLGNKSERFMISIYNASKSDEHEFIHFVLTRD